MAVTGTANFAILVIITTYSLIFATPTGYREISSTNSENSEDAKPAAKNPETTIDNTTEFHDETKFRINGSLSTSGLIDGDKKDFEWKFFSETRKRTILADNELLWPSVNIGYEVLPNLPIHQRLYLSQAMRVIENSCCIKFFEIKPGDVKKNGNYFTIFTYQDDCSSTVARACRSLYNTCVPFMNLGKQCDTPAMLHELMHMLGFIHEHSRPDREKYVKIMYENIRNPTRHASDFGISKYKVRTDSPYDFDSVMHYRLGALSKPGVDTIRPIAYVPEGVTIGPKGHLSEMDIVRLNRYYCKTVRDPKQGGG